jgi:hypothetical protein
VALWDLAKRFERGESTLAVLITKAFGNDRFAFEFRHVGVQARLPQFVDPISYTLSQDPPPLKGLGPRDIGGNGAIIRENGALT